MTSAPQETMYIASPNSQVQMKSNNDGEEMNIKLKVP